MFVFRSQAKKVIACFEHWSDAVEFEQANRGRCYERIEVPGMDQQIDTFLSQSPPVDPRWDEVRQ